MSVTGWIIIAVVVIGAVIALFGWDRYRGNQKRAADGAGVQPTSEVFMDPATGQRMRVWYNAKTGEREYRPDSD
jgi:hypothetical protein